MAMEKDAALSLKELMADGGMTANWFVMQFIADLLNKQVVSIPMPDVSALGAAYMAGLKAWGVRKYSCIEKIETVIKKAINPERMWKQRRKTTRDGKSDTEAN
jgi:glycerol kinase